MVVSSSCGARQVHPLRSTIDFFTAFAAVIVSLYLRAGRYFSNSDSLNFDLWGSISSNFSSAITDHGFETFLPFSGHLVHPLAECEVLAELNLFFELGLHTMLVELLKSELDVP